MKKRNLPMIKGNYNNIISNPNRITKKENSHKIYKNSNGIIVPSVTTVIGIINNPYLIQWSNKIGLEGKKYKSVLNSSANIGTLVHTMIESYFKGTNDELEGKLSQCNESEISQANKAYENFLRWIDNNPSIEIIYSENEYVSDTYNYGGTLDLYGKINDSLILIDYKTSNYFDKKMFIQIAGYKNLLEENNKQVDSGRIIKLSKIDDKFEEMSKTNEELEIYWKLFKSCLLTYKLNNKLEREWSENFKGNY